MGEIFIKQEKQFFSIKEWSNIDKNLIVGFTTKNGGISIGDYQSLNLGFHVGDEQQSVVKNKAILAERINFPLDHWVAAEQTHKTNIRRVTKKDRGLGSYDYSTSIKDTDGLYTTEEGILLTLCYADCVPIYFYAPKQHYIGVVHAGWKGSVAGIALEMVQKWQAEGVPIEDIFVIIGPSICQNCYIVDDKVIEQVDKTVEDVSKKPYNLISKGQYRLDLKKLNQQLLLRAGVKHIAITNLCTSCDELEFFSYRRDGGKTGRLMSYIGWKEDLL
ncbi:MULTISPECIES: peptidoglycan editing factor PgeF [Bacillus]|uniref:peptidoglycan editing factor PgeF n=1 Tax=Bacillus TaxID=1386 RepID=UPI00030A1541|nr:MULTISPECIES: peptidoglycan editing factor PgeF [Bacillus]